MGRSTPRSILLTLRLLSMGPDQERRTVVRYLVAVDPQAGNALSDLSRLHRRQLRDWRQTGILGKGHRHVIQRIGEAPNGVLDGATGCRGEEFTLSREIAHIQCHRPLVIVKNPFRGQFIHQNDKRAVVDAYKRSTHHKDSPATKNRSTQDVCTHGMLISKDETLTARPTLTRQ